MRERREGASDAGGEASHETAVGKRTRVEAVQRRAGATRTGQSAAFEAAPAGEASELGDDPFGFHLVGAADAGRATAAVQRQAASDEGAASDDAVRASAAAGVAGGGEALPHGAAIQASFGPAHDLSRVRAHVGGDAEMAARSIGAEAYATGHDVAFASSPDLHTAAHEAAHVVQQQRGVQLKGGVGEAGDVHEQHADAVADRVVRGESAADLLAGYGAGAAMGQASAPIQRAERGAGEITPPAAGLNQTGFIDNSDGANLRTGPLEAGGKTVIDKPLPPATRVFVSGKHPTAAQWWYVTAFLPDQIVRGYVQDFRVTTDLPEPLAKLYQVKAGDTAEKLAVQEFKASVRDGHDLRYYENVLLHVNKERGRAGITGSYQDPGLFGGGANNVQLVAGHRIWLVSPAYAQALEGVVPDGSLTNGVYAKVKRFAQHILDIIRSVDRSPQFLDEVAGEYAQAIRDHMFEIIGVVGAFVAAELASTALAASPTGVGQLAAALIQILLALLGAKGLVDASVAALQHASGWLETAWTAKGDDAKIALASKEFLRMLVSIAMAALAYTGFKGNASNAFKLMNNLPTGAPAFALAGGGTMGGGGAIEGVALGPPNPLGAAGTAMAMSTKEVGGGGASKEDLARELESVKKQLESPELSGKQKKALRARKKELQEQLGVGGAEPPAEEVPTPTRFKERKAGLTDKEAATDKPSWIDHWPDGRPGVDESGTVFATRMMNKKYGVGGWEREGAQGTEFSQLKKFGDRAFE